MSTAPEEDPLVQLGLKKRVLPDTLLAPPIPKPAPAAPAATAVTADHSTPLSDLEAAAFQRVATPLEKTLNALTVPHRALARAAGDASASLGGANGGQRFNLFRSLSEGAKDPGAGYLQNLDRTPGLGETIDMPLPDFPGDAPISRPMTVRQASTPLAAGAEVFFDPATYAGVGSITKAGEAYRALKVEYDVAKMALNGARAGQEVIDAGTHLMEVEKRLNAAKLALEAEGTARSGGRAAVQFGGRTAPVLAQDRVVEATQKVLAKAGKTRIGRGISTHFQPPSMRVDPAVRARGFEVSAAGAVGRREAARGLSDLVEEYPDLLKAVGGDHQTLDDALSLAHERSQGRRLNQPLDWVSEERRNEYWSTPDNRVREAIIKEGQQAAEASTPRYLRNADREQHGKLLKRRKRNAARRALLEADSSNGPRDPFGLTPEESQAHLDALERERMHTAITTEDATAHSEEKPNPGGKAEVDRLVREAQAKFGSEVSADNARDLFPTFNENLTTRSLHASSVHEAASSVTKAWWKDELAKPPKHNAVLVTGGGPGSGKTSGLPKNIFNEVDAVYDAASGKGTERAVAQALASGRDVMFYFTVRDPFDAWANGVLPRATKQGRTVTAKLAAEAHTKGIGNTRALVERFRDKIDEGRVQFNLVDNRHGLGKHRVISGEDAVRQLFELPVENEGQLLERFNQETERQARAGLIPHRVYVGANLNPIINTEAGRAALAEARARTPGVGNGGPGAPAAGAVGHAPGGSAALTRTDIESAAYAREQERVTKELESITADDAAVKAEMDRMSEKAQRRINAETLRHSIMSARRMYFRGASPEVAKKFGDFAARTIDRLNIRNATMFSNTVAEGVQLAELTDPQAYMMHAATPELQKAILEHAAETGVAPRGMSWRDFSEKHGAQLTRKLRMTAVEANQLGQVGKLSIAGNKPIKQAFYTNPFIAQTFREQQGTKSIAYARHLREMANTYGLPKGQAPAGWKAVPNNIEGIGDKILFDPDVADHLTRHFEALKSPGKILEAYDRLNQVWKTYTLGIFPVYHTRNEIGDLWNAIVLGGGDLKWAPDAMQELVHGTKLSRGPGGGTVKFPDGRVFQRGQLRDEAEGLGLFESQQLQQEIEQNVLGELADPDAGGLPGAPAVRRIGRAVREAGAGETGARRMTSKVGAGLNAAQEQLTDNRAIGAAMAIGNARESALRLTLYIDRRARGWSPHASALWVRKHLLDYGQTSNFENEVMRRVFPFYTWTRHNAPLQLEYLFAKPGAFGNVQKLRDTAERNNPPSGLEDQPLPSFLAEGVPVRTGTSKEGNPEFWRLEGTWPGSDALVPLSPALDPEGAARRAGGLLNPLMSEAFEQYSNTDLWRSMPGKNVPIEDFPGQQGSFLGMPMDKRTIHALSNVRLLTELNRLNPGDVFGTADTPAYGGRGTVREYPDLDPSQRWMNVLLGRGYAVDPARNRNDWNRAVEHAVQVLEREIKLDEQRGKTAQAEAARRRLQQILENPESISPDMAK